MPMFQVLAFDRKGGRWKRGEHLVSDAGERVRAERVLRQPMMMSPARFTAPVQLDAGVVVTVEWESAVRAVGVAYLRLGKARAVACLLLGGVDELAEETMARALQAELGVTPGHPLCPAFTTIRRDRRRPLLAAFKIGDTIDGNSERGLVTVEWALANAYFGMYDLIGGETEVGDQPAVS
jgi:hypothetical protein